MKVLMLEGTAEEIKEVAHLFMNDPEIASIQTSEGEIQSPEVSDVDPVLAIRAMLTRRPPSNGQKAIFQALADGRLEYSEYQRRIGRQSRQIGGLHSALARRLDNTPQVRKAGLPRGYTSVLTETKEGGKRYWSLTPEAIEALGEEGLI